MPILVLPPRRTPDADAIGAAALQAGWTVERLASWRVPKRLKGRDLVLYGEPLFADVVTAALGIALLEPAADWLARLPDVYRRREVRLLTLGEARAQPTPSFIKPADDKCFPAAIYGAGSALPASTGDLPTTTPVLVSEPVTWEVEFRCFVRDRAVTTFSPYLRSGMLAWTEDGRWPAAPREIAAVRDYMAALLADAAVRLPAAVVVDIGRIAGRGWAVVEANAAWGSGIYGCDARCILPVLARASLPSDTISAEDTEWIRRQYVVEPAPQFEG